MGYRGSYSNKWALGLPLMAAGILSCGPKSDSKATDEEQKTGAEDKAPPQPGVSANTSNALVVTGQLAITGTTLADTARSLVMYSMDNQGNVVSKKLVEVNAEGKFSVDIGRSQLEKLESAISDKSVDRAKLKELFPQYASKIDEMPEEELRQGFAEEIAKKKKNPDLRYVLVSYVKSGNPEEEASSMQFIGLPTRGSNLKMLPGESLKGDTNLGKIIGSGDEATSELKASDSLNLSESVLEELGSASKTLKILKNEWMNPVEKVRITPWFSFAKTNLGDTVNKFTPPTDIVIAGGGYYMGVQDIGATFGEVCPPNPANAADKTGNAYDATPAKKVSWYPPVAIETGSPPTTFGPSNPYTNVASQYSRKDQYGELQCGIAGQTSSGMYTRAKSDGDKEYQLQLGASFKGSSPEGLWRMKVDETEVGRWDLAAAAPYDKDGKPVIYVPAIKVLTNSDGIATGFEAKFYFYDKASSSYREVTDTAGLTKLLHSFNMDGGYSQSRPGGDLSVSQEDIAFVGGIVQGKLKTQDQALFPCPDSSGSVQCIKNFGFSYLIGAISYRMSLSASGTP